MIELGADSENEPTLFSGQAIKNALPEVSRVRLNQTLYAEYPKLRRFLDALDGEKSTQSLRSLSRIWDISPTSTSKTGQQLVEIGFFEKIGEKSAPLYRIPFVYRSILNIQQGTEELWQRMAVRSHFGRTASRRTFWTGARRVPHISIWVV